MDANPMTQQARVPSPPESRRHSSHHASREEANAGWSGSISLLRALFDQVSDGIVVGSTTDGRCVHTNAALSHLLGYKPEELVGKHLEEILGEQDASRFSTLRQTLRPSQVNRGVWPLRRSDGTWLMADVTLTILADGQWQALVRDNSGRQGAAESLRLSEERFSGIYAVSADAIISIDEAHRITLFNDSASVLFGYSAEEIIGSPLEVLIPERFRGAHRQHIERFSAGQEPARHMGSRRTRIYGLRKNGEEFPTDAAISKLEIAGKRILTVCLRDLSEQERSESEQHLLADVGEILVQAGSDYTRLLNDIATKIASTIAAWCAIDIAHAGDSRRVKIVHSDPAMAESCKALEAELTAQQADTPYCGPLDASRPILVHDPGPEVLASVIQNEAQMKLLRTFDAASLIVVPLIARSHPLGTLALGSPRTSRRYDARDAQQAAQLASRVALAVDNARLHEALERAVKARDDVLGIVAHDLRSPLNAIVLGAHNLRRPRGQPERRNQTAADIIHRSAMSMHRLIEDLLDVVRLEAGQSLAITPGEVPTLNMLTEAIERQLTANPARRRDIALEATGAPPTIWADRARLLQVFDNLLGNAMKFSRNAITVRCARVKNEALFSVADDGPGIRAEDLPRIFDRFWQASPPDLRGAGLGLSIVEAIVRAHRGHVWAESKPGEGTTFFFTLPA